MSLLRVRGVLGIGWLAVWCVLGCGGPATLPLRAVTSRAVTSADGDAALAAGERYAVAGSAAQMRAAVEAARQAAPHSARYHELAADLAFWEDRAEDAYGHLLEALLDRDADYPELALAELEDAELPLSLWPQAQTVLRTLVALHPRADLRAHAAYVLGALCAVRADRDCQKDMAQVYGAGTLPWAVIGAWDNEQGKRFDAPLPPEDEVVLTARYPGTFVEVGWRTDAPVDHLGRLSLGALMHPDKWAVAYAASGVRIPADGVYELRLASTGPLKVWVNGRPVFEDRSLDADVFDGIVVPLTLKAGENQVLIKSAHREGRWSLLARLTGVNGVPLAGLEPLAPRGGKVMESTQPVRGMPQVLAERLAPTKGGPLRRALLEAQSAGVYAQGELAVRVTQAFLSAHPESPHALFLAAMAQWGRGERDHTAELLGALDRAVGKDFPLVRAKRARFWRQQGLTRAAQRTLLELTHTSPGALTAWSELAALFEAEGWTEDQCLALEQRVRLSRTVANQTSLARCQDSLGLRASALKWLEALEKEAPGSWDTLALRYDFAFGRGDYPRSVATARRMREALPMSTNGLFRLAEALRRQDKLEEAKATLEQAKRLSPDDPAAYERLARVHYPTGDIQAAVAAWRAALERNPDDQGLALRLAYLAPEDGSRLTQEAPDELALERVLAGRRSVKALPGANVAYLLDHEVTQLNADGSTTSVITQVTQALNESGRDKLTAWSLEAGRPRVFHAYAVDAQGKRTEASSIRGSSIRFRGLEVGSVVVLQYRLDAPPTRFLSKHLAKTWFFQGAADQRAQSEWILLLPEHTTLHEAGVGQGYEREESTVSGMRRVRWWAQNVPPLVPEPAMPNLAERALSLSVSTVPDWELFVKWEDALIHDAFRVDEALERRAKELVAGAKSPLDKVLHIHEFIIQQIRYQQDYENVVAGVKPHPAPVVLERGYGDCKDKAVLFITLARLVGVEVHYALVHTRNLGPLRKGTPSQQFNHAIVYVPAQEGFPEGRFFDPTVDALDLEVLRDDDQGTESLVYDPLRKQHAWREIPFDAPEKSFWWTEEKLSVTEEGTAQSTLRMVAKGRSGAALRQSARNEKSFEQAIQQMAQLLFPGASAATPKAVEVKSLWKPAEVELQMSRTSGVSRSGTELRLKVGPLSTSARSMQFGLVQRKHPLLLGTPNQMRWATRLSLPEGQRVKTLPREGRVESPCLRYGRSVTREPHAVLVTDEVEWRCERVDAEAYGALRTEVERMHALAGEELVLTTTQSVPVVRPAAAVAPKKGVPPRDSKVP